MPKFRSSWKIHPACNFQDKVLRLTQTCCLQEMLPALNLVRNNKLRDFFLILVTKRFQLVFIICLSDCPSRQRIFIFFRIVKIKQMNRRRIKIYREYEMLSTTVNLDEIRKFFTLMSCMKLGSRENQNNTHKRDSHHISRTIFYMYMKILVWEPYMLQIAFLCLILCNTLLYDYFLQQYMYFTCSWIFFFKNFHDKNVWFFFKVFILEFYIINKSFYLYYSKIKTLKKNQNFLVFVLYFYLTLQYFALFEQLSILNFVEFWVQINVLVHRLYRSPTKIRTNTFI